MIDNSYIASLIQYLRAETTLAWEQSQNGGSTEAKNEARVAYDYMNALLVRVEQEYQEYKNEFFDTTEGTNDND